MIFVLMHDTVAKLDVSSLDACHQGDLADIV